MRVDGILYWDRSIDNSNPVGPPPTIQTGVLILVGLIVAVLEKQLFAEIDGVNKVQGSL